MGVGREEMMGIELVGELVEGVGEKKLFGVSMEWVEEWVGDIEIVDKVEGEREKFMGVEGEEKMGVVIVLVFEGRDDGGEVRVFVLVEVWGEELEFVDGVVEMCGGDGVEEIGESIEFERGEGILMVGGSKDDGGGNV